MTRTRTLGLLMAAALIPATTWGQNPDDYSLQITDDVGGIGQQVTLENLLDFGDACCPISGWSWSQCHDSAFVEIVEVEDGFTTLQLDVAFAGLTLLPGQGWTMGVVIDFFGIVTLEPGNGYQLHLATYDLLAEGTTTVEYCDTLGSPPVQTILTDTSGGTFVPVLTSGTVEIGQFAPFVLRAGSGVGSPTLVTTVAMELENPVGIDGFNFGVSHDGALLSVMSADQGAAVATTNGGAGADFFSLLIDPGGAPGVLVGCLISLSSPFEQVPPPAPGEASELVVVDYEVNASAPDGSQASLDFTDDLGVPPVPIAITVSGSSVLPTLESGMISVSGDPILVFRRGDTDSDGEVGIIDVVFLANWLFGGGPMGTCDDAADVDDNGSLNLVDPIAILDYLFTSGPPPAAPFPDCGEDPTDDSLDCVSYDGGC